MPPDGCGKRYRLDNGHNPHDVKAKSMKRTMLMLLLANGLLLAAFPSRPALGFTLLFWVFAAGCIGYYHVTSTIEPNGSSHDPPIPPM